MFWIIAGLVFVGFFFATCVCCGCVIKSDDFNRTAGTDIGSDWTEEAGAWEIVSGADNFLRTASSDAVLVLNESVTDTDYAIEFKIEAIPNNDPIRIYIREDADNYFAFELQSWTTLTNSYMTIYQAVSGVETVLVQAAQRNSPITPFRIRVCVYAETGVTFGYAQQPSGTPPTTPGAFIASDSIVAYAAPTGQEVAIGTGTSIGGNVDIDDFFVWRRSDSCADCQACCENDTLPTQQVQMEVAGMGGDSCDCSGLDGTYILDFIGHTRSAHATGFGTGGCLYRLDMEETTCGVTRADFFHNANGAHGGRRYMATLSNEAALLGTAGGKAAFFRGTEGIAFGGPEFCPFDRELVLSEFWNSNDLIELCYSTSSGRVGTATVTAV